MRNITLVVCGFYWLCWPRKSSRKKWFVCEGIKGIRKFSFAELKKSAVKKQSQLFVESNQIEMEIKKTDTEKPVKH